MSILFHTLYYIQLSPTRSLLTPESLFLRFIKCLQYLYTISIYPLVNFVLIWILQFSLFRCLYLFFLNIVCFVLLQQTPQDSGYQIHVLKKLRSKIKDMDHALEVRRMKKYYFVNFIFPFIQHDEPSFNMMSHHST